MDIGKIEFHSNELVQCTLTVNNTKLFAVLQTVIGAMQKMMKKMEQVEGAMTQVQGQMDSLRGELNDKLAEQAQWFNQKIDALRRETRRELDAIKDAKDEKADRMAEEIATLQKQLKQTKSDIQAELIHLGKRSDEVEATLNTKMTALEDDVNGQLHEQKEKFTADLQEHTNTLASQEERIATSEKDLTALFGIFDMNRQNCVTISKLATDTKLGYLNELPVFAALYDFSNKEKQRVEQKFDNVHKRMGAAEQAISRKADQRDLEELRDVMDHEDVDAIIQRHNEQINELYQICDTTDKALSIGLEKKADRTVAEQLEEDVETLEARVREILDSAGNSKWQQLLTRVEELDHYTQKLDRRKVGRSDLQRMAKRLRQQMVGDAMHEGGGVGMMPGSAMSGGGGGGYSSPDEMGSTAFGSAQGGGGIGYRGGDGGSMQSQYYRSQMSGGGGQIMADSAFIRYRCLSCNKPSAKLVDESLRKPAAQFPPSALLTTNPGSPVNTQTRARIQDAPLAAAVNGAIRQERKLDNYFHWVEGHGYNNADSSDKEDEFPSRPTSTDGQGGGAGPSSGIMMSMSERKRKKVRTSLIGTDNRLYDGLAELPDQQGAGPSSSGPSPGPGAGSSSSTTAPSPAPSKTSAVHPVTTKEKRNAITNARSADTAVASP